MVTNSGLQDDTPNVTAVRQQRALHILATAVEHNPASADIWLAYLLLMAEYGFEQDECRGWAIDACARTQSFGLFRYRRDVSAATSEQLDVSCAALTWVVSTIREQGTELIVLVLL